MNKQHISSPRVGQPAKRINYSARGVSSMKPAQQEECTKVSRDDVSRCLHIWANFYHQSETRLGGRELCLPPRRWSKKD